MADPGGPFLGVATSATGRIWRAREVDERRAGDISRRLGAPDLIGRLLAGRGVTAEGAQQFLTPTLKDLFPDPSSFADMDVAAAAILDAIVAQRPIAIFADYDVDGGTSSAILTRYMRAWGCEPMLYVPDRLQEGFGPTPGAFRTLKDRGAQMVVTVDCGAAAIDALRTALEIGLDVVVMDHHLMHDEHTPRTLALVNPNRPDDRSGCGHLAAAGVVFVLIAALNRLARSRGIAPPRGLPDPMNWLDLAALGTLCDMAPLKGVNRAFAVRGLQVLSRLENPGLAALSRVAEIDAPQSVYHATFLLGPRLNAGGRVGDPWLAARLLATDDPDEAMRLAELLHRLNTERRQVEADILSAARVLVDARLRERPDAPVLVVGAEGWHPGVIGIVAGRLKETYHRPAIVIGWGEGLGPVARGSGRSTPGVNLGELIAAAARAGVILGGGGHAMAAGLSCRPDQVDGLRMFLEDHGEVSAGLLEEARVLELDGLLSAEAADMALLKLIEQAGPYGAGAPEPVFAVPDVRPWGIRRVGDAHLAFDLKDTGPPARRAIAFRMADGPAGDLLREGRRLHLAARLKADTWRGRDAVQLEVVDVAAAA